MDWSAYEVFSVLSGIVLVVAAAIPGMTVKDRLWSLVGGVFFIGYAFYVASQTSGTFEFPVVIFIVPFAAVAYAGYKFYEFTSSRP